MQQNFGRCCNHGWLRLLIRFALASVLLRILTLDGIFIPVCLLCSSTGSTTPNQKNIPLLNMINFSCTHDHSPRDIKSASIGQTVSVCAVCVCVCLCPAFQLCFSILQHVLGYKRGQLMLHSHTTCAVLMYYKHTHTHTHTHMLW